MLVVVARSCWFLDPLRDDALSIHRLLDIHWRCFYFFVSPDWVGIHFVWIDWVRFMSPQFYFIFIFPFFNNIYEHLTYTGIYKTFQLLDRFSIPFICFGLLPYQKKKLLYSLHFILFLSVKWSKKLHI